MFSRRNRFLYFGIVELCNTEFLLVPCTSSSDHSQLLLLENYVSIHLTACQDRLDKLCPGLLELHESDSSCNVRISLNDIWTSLLTIRIIPIPHNYRVFSNLFARRTSGHMQGGSQHDKGISHDFIVVTSLPITMRLDTTNQKEKSLAIPHVFELYMEKKREVDNLTATKFQASGMARIPIRAPKATRYQRRTLISNDCNL